MALGRDRLDDRILSRAPSDDPDVADRSALLVEPSTRRKLAARLRAIAAEVIEPERLERGRTCLRLRRAEIAEARPALLALCRDLAEEPEVSPRGVILAARLIHDGRSPLYAGGNPEIFGVEGPPPVETAIRHARTALLMG